MEPQKNGKKYGKKNPLQQLNLNQFISITDKQQLRKATNQLIRPLSYKNKEELQVMLSSAISKKYCKQDKDYKCLTEQGFRQMVKNIQLINCMFKQSQISSPIADSFNNVFIQYLQIAQQNKLVTSQDIFPLWEVIPFRNLENFLDKLNLKQCYKNQDKQKFTKILIGLLNESKIVQCCVYYRIFGELPEFQQKILIPKLLHSDQIYTPFIIELLRSRPMLKQKIVQQIDQAKAVIILQHLQQDPRKYDKTNKFILRKHYLSMCHQYQSWQIFEDKMSFNPMFLQWYCQEKDIPQQIKQSIRYRNKIGGKEQKVPNPLFLHDSFCPAQLILSKFQKQYEKQPNMEQKYLSLSFFGIKEQDVHFISDSSSQMFKQMIENLSNCSYVGFDAQYRCTSTKYEQLGVAIIQISTGKQIYIVDFIKLENDQIFIQFFKQILSNPKLIVVGHSVQSDVKFIEKTMKIQQLKGVADIAKMFKQKFPNQTLNSLAFMTNFMLGKHLSKYEQRSNWNRRPLKKTQVHYAALDAQVCIALYEMLKQQQVKLTQAIVKNKKNTISNIVRKENIVYRQDNEKLLKDPKPKFLVDSMLKRLCSLLRNLGIDSEYMAVSNYELMQETAKKQDRIILTRDRKLLNKKSPEMPIYCIAEKGDSDLMLQQIKKQFNIDFNLFSTLSRCVKCNCPELEIISKEQAMKFVNFQYEDTNVQQFWRCLKCKQIYWEGNQFKNAKKKFQQLK